MKRIENYKNTSKENMNEPIKNKNSINIIYPHKTGLYNINESSYINAVIQCLSNIELLSNYLLKIYENYNSKDYPLTYEYSNLIDKLFNDNEKCIYNISFKQTIEDLNYSKIKDSKVLIDFILKQLHKELNKIKNNNISIKNDFNKEELDTSNENNMFNQYFNDFSSNNKSIISDLFYGAIRLKMECSKCGIIKYKFEPFYLLSFQLSKIKKNKKKELGYNYYNDDININLYDAFFDAKREKIDFCDNCQSKQKVSIQKDIYYLNKILIIHLDRGINNQQFKEKIEIPEKLDLSIFAIKKEKTRFYLYGIIALVNEKYCWNTIALCRNDSKKNYFCCYNDDKISQIDINEIMEKQFNGKYEVGDIIPYILIYIEES